MIKFEISVDDGCELDSRIADLCERYNIPCTFYIPILHLDLALAKGYPPLTQPTYDRLVANHEIGSHGVSHAYLTKIQPQAARYEVFESKKMLENIIGRPVTKFCYPRGYTTNEIMDWVREAGYSYARSTAIGSLDIPPEPLFAPTTVHIGCPKRPEYEGTTWLDYAKDMITKAKSIEDQDPVYHAWCHSWEIDKYDEWDNVYEFFRLISE